MKENRIIRTEDVTEDFSREYTDLVIAWIDEKDKIRSEFRSGSHSVDEVLKLCTEYKDLENNEPSYLKFLDGKLKGDVCG